MAQYLRDANWYQRSYSSAAEVTGNPAKAETKTHVRKLLRGPSTRLTRELIDDEDDETSSVPVPGGTAVLAPTKSTSRLPVGGDSPSSKDGQIAALVAALARSEQRHAEVLVRMEGMQAQLTELTSAVRALGAAEAAPEEGGGVLQWTSGLFNVGGQRAD